LEDEENKGENWGGESGGEIAERMAVRSVMDPVKRMVGWLVVDDE